MLQRQIRDTPFHSAHRGVTRLVRGDRPAIARQGAGRSIPVCRGIPRGPVTRNWSTGDGGHREDVCGRGQGEPVARADRDRDARSLAAAARCGCCITTTVIPPPPAARTRRQHDLGSGGRRCDARGDRRGAWLRHAARDATEAANEPTPAVALPSIAETQPPIAQPVETVATKTPVREDTRAVEPIPPPAVEPAAPIAPPSVAPRRVAARAATTPVAPPVEVSAPVEAPEPVERRPERSVEVSNPILVFETRALVGTRKSKEQGARC